MANRFWVGDGGNWSDNTNHWSASTGGAPNASLPTSSDNVYFDASSFTTGSQTVTVDATAAALDMDWTGATNTPSFSSPNNNIFLECYGDVTLINAMTLSFGGNSRIIMRGAASSFTTNGNNTQIRINSYIAGATLTLGDAFNSPTGDIVVRQGGFSTGNFDVTAAYLNQYDGTAKTVTLGTSTINIGEWNFVSGGLTLTANTATINVSGTGAFAGGGITTYNNVALNGTAHTISGSNTFNTFTLKADTTQTITFTDGTTQTITTPVLTGSIGKVKTLVGTSTAGWAITQSGWDEISCDYMSISYSTATPDNLWFAGENYTDGGNNAGWVFSSPPHRGGWLRR